MRNYLFALLVVLSSCNTETDTDDDIETVSIIENNETLTIDSEVSYVQLETKDECLLDYVINIEVTDDYIYILDRQTFYIFRCNGEFVKRINRGKGPGELTRALNFSIDLRRNEISIIEQGRFLHLYTLDAEYIETHSIEGSFADAVRVNDENFLLHTALPAIHADHLVSVYNLKSKSITKKFISTENVLMKNLTALTYNNFSILDDGIIYSAPNSRNIYKYSGDSMTLFKKINFQDLDPDESYINKFGRDGGGFMKQAYEDNYIGFINYYYPLDDFSLVGFKYKDNNCGVIFKDNPSKIYFSTFSELFNLPISPSFQYPKNAKKNQIYFVYYNDLLQNDSLYSENMILEIGANKIKIQENANPIIVTVNLKK